MAKSTHHQDDDLVMSGQQLCNMLGISRTKAFVAINHCSLGFPNPVKQKNVGKRVVDFYLKTDVEDFMSRVDLKKTKIVWPQCYRGAITGQRSDSRSSVTQKIDSSLYFNFMNVDQVKLQSFGFGHYE